MPFSVELLSPQRQGRINLSGVPRGKNAVVTESCFLDILLKYVLALGTIAHKFSPAQRRFIILYDAIQIFNLTMTVLSNTELGKLAFR